jgi:hypothetical protein
LQAATISDVAVTVDDVRAVASGLPRAYEVVVRGRLKFRVKQIVFLAFSKDGETMGLGFPKDWRRAVVEAEPEKFSLPGESDLRFNWIHVRLAALDHEEMRDLVENAWALCVPNYVVEEYVRRPGARRRPASRGGAADAR